MLTLVMGNRNYSSWSLRAWLYLRASGIEFDEIVIPLFTDAWRSEIATYSPAGRVPVLLDDELNIWDTLAIIETVRERYPHAVGWPADAAARARARSVSAEMHSGFLNVRDELPQNIRARRPLAPDDLSEDCRQQIHRIEAIWSDRTHARQGPWLFGEFSIADVMFAPVALRFVTYGIELERPAQDFVAQVCGLPLIQEWSGLCHDEPYAIPFIDELMPAAESQLTLG